MAPPLPAASLPSNTNRIRAELARAHLAADVQTQLQPPPLGGGEAPLVLLGGEALRQIQRIESTHRQSTPGRRFDSAFTSPL